MGTISIIAALAANRTIGKDGDLPWHLPADLKRFKRLTGGHPMVMGRRTFESIGSKPLPGRRTVVLTGRPGWSAPGVESASTLGEALALLAGAPQVFIAGGAEVYRQALAVADRLYLTWIKQDFAGDTFFPEFAESDWRLIEEECHPAGDGAPFAWRFSTYDRHHSQALP